MTFQRSGYPIPLFRVARRKPNTTLTATTRATIPISKTYPTVAGRPRNIGAKDIVTFRGAPLFTASDPEEGEAAYPATLATE